MVSYSPLNRVHEFEGLAAAVRANRDLWQSRRLTPQIDARIDAGELERLKERAAEQLRTLHDIHQRAVTLAFVPGAVEELREASVPVDRVEDRPEDSGPVGAGGDDGGGDVGEVVADEELDESRREARNLSVMAGIFGRDSSSSGSARAVIPADP